MKVNRWLIFGIAFFAINFYNFLDTDTGLRYFPLFVCVLLSHLIYVEVRTLNQGSKQ